MSLSPEYTTTIRGSYRQHEPIDVATASDSSVPADPAVDDLEIGKVATRCPNDWIVELPTKTMLALCGWSGLVGGLKGGDILSPIDRPDWCARADASRQQRHDENNGSRACAKG